MKIITEPTGGHFRAFDEDTYDGAIDAEWPSNCIGIGETREEAETDLREQLMNDWRDTENHMVLPWADDEFVEPVQPDVDEMVDQELDETDSLSDALLDIGRVPALLRRQAG